MIVRERTIHTITLNRSQTVPAMVTSSSIKLADPISISVDDIYNIAERERLCYSARGRRHAVARAQRQTYKMDEVYKSRPHTSASGYIDSYRREMVTPTKSIRSEPVPSRVSSRAGGDLDEEYEADEYPINYINTPSVCCEVIGPQACEECIQAHRRRIEREKFDARFPSLRMSSQNITTSALLKRYFPDLTHEDILIKLARGEIAKPNILSRPVCRSRTDKRSRDRDAIFPSHARESIGIARNKQSNIQTKIKSMFFVNIEDLNMKINSGKVSRSLGFNHQPSKKKTASTEFQTVFPSFVSPRKVSFISEASGRKFHYEPPLLPKENQVQEPGFFAGSDATYELPERLPDTIEFVKEGNTIDESALGGEHSDTDDDISLDRLEENKS
ncbi:uncharacterized protein LOC125675661 isoform X2 [Ostrea edulis]|uniref:uncharacterized protein LOC125675661 isoform X2 n=1 Tax=Ostrea edulis TaxID=37623 RepID=UPI0024AEBD28|nr:uncharacterized protein LOC125675661 isoform X2 [Ostrea edulis]